ncbi:hypothetical protein J2X66_004235 [Pseudomonas sp. 3296]|uniref:hypothetical protein n=1 Tax=Pseudomonas sp. 3296 TaxID=2817753 RepID=UPI002865B69B|nr:hypothetical protein [Pseudomonas sp. 3296]MDR6917356.1 hypothetical protein [Pseudomonas sp. 3296]
MTANTSKEPDQGLFALPLSVEGVDDNDPDGYVPLEILRNGTRIIIPYWPNPLPGDELWINRLQNGIEERLYTVFLSPPQPAFLYFILTPQHLVTDGSAYLYYTIWKGSGGIDDPSPHRKLTIDHTPPLRLKEPRFPDATLWGYLNNKTVPPLMSGVTVAIPDAIGYALPGDIAKVYWQGYSSLNGAGPPVPGTYGVWDKTLEQSDIDMGYRAVIPFDPHVKLLFNDDSALANWRVFRAGRLIGESRQSLVKIDRVTPGESGPNGLNAQGENTMALQLSPPKQRPFSIGVKEVGPFSVITIDTLVDNLIAKSVLDSGNLTINLARTLDEEELDDVDVLVGIKGSTLEVVGTIPLGPIGNRPAGNIPLNIPSSFFLEQPTPAGPTIYEVQVKVYKGGGGIEDPSNVTEVASDQTAPFHLKNPRREVRPTPAPTFVNRPADPQVTVNEAWRALPANANLNLAMNVGYALRRLDDHLRVWLVSSTGTQRVLVWDDVVPASGAISIPNTVLSQLPNGRVNVLYDWSDVSGNRSLESVSTAFLTLALAQIPVLTKAPLVPKTDPNYSTSLFLDDFVDGITAIVENAFIQNAEPGDHVHLVLEDAADATNYLELTPQPWANANLTFPLAYTDLAQLFADSDKPKAVTIKSVITRTGMIPDVESREATIMLAFDYAGPPNPDIPDLNNPAMQLPVVTGASGTANSLLPGDRDKAGTFKVVFALTDPDITPEQTAKCYINNEWIADYVPFVEERGFEVPIPAPLISRLPTPQVNAHWSIQKSGTDKNVMTSLPQSVAVGGIPIPLPLPTIAIRNPANRDFIECFGMISPTSNYVLGLRIPKSPLLPPGKTITAHFAAYLDLAGTQLIPNTSASQDYVIKAADVLDVAPVGSPEVFKAAQPVRGAIAYGKYWYTTVINGTQTSEPVIKRLDTISNSFNYCDQTATPAA